MSLTLLGRDEPRKAPQKTLQIRSESSCSVTASCVLRSRDELALTEREEMFTAEKSKAEGEAVGAVSGCREGCPVGAREGLVEGDAKGWTEGRREGRRMGWEEGCELGCMRG